MSPLWGFKDLCIPCCYKHAAPLGLNTPMSPSRLCMMFHLSAQSWVGFQAQRVGRPNPYASNLPLSRIRPSPITYCAPLEWGLEVSAFYTHVAPLGL